ncbi:MAG: tetratricopeptide repeat protein [Methylococcales bacterium]
MRYLLNIVILSLFTPLCWSDDAVAEKLCKNNAGAKLDSLQGKVFFDPDSNGHWQPAKLYDFICEGSRVRVERYSRASLSLTGGVILRIDEGTVLSLNGLAQDKATLLELLKGFIHFISRTPKHLEITSPIANAGPEGTEFAMRVDDTSASLWVYEGGVKFFNPKGSIHLKPGQGAQALLGQAPRVQINVKPEDAVNWALYYPPILPYPDAATVIDSSIRKAIQDYRQGHVDVAITQLDSLSAEQQTPYFYKVRAAMHLTAGLDKLALQDIQVLLAKNPNDAEALALKSIRALTQNHKEEAYTLATQAVAANSQSASAYSALSYIEQGQFHLDKAQAAADQAAKLAPQDAMVWARKAELELSQGLTSESQQAAEKALELDANLERTQTVMGFSHLLQMDTDKALQSFKKAVQLDSTSPLARLGLGLTKIRKGHLQEGRQDLEIAAVLDPNDAILRSYLGKAYYEERRSSMADEQFKLAKVRDPKDPTPYFYDAINKQTTNRPVEALQDMQTAVELNDNRGFYRSKLLIDQDKAVRGASLGRIYKDLGFDDVARQQATTALTTDPSNYTAHRLLADSYLNRPRQEVARASEVLQAQLLQPLNYNPIQPQLAYTDLNIPKSAGFADTSFNEYSRLFEGNQHRFTATGLYGSNDTRADEAVISGIHDKFAYSLGQMHYQTDGFRPNADLKHNLYNVFTQYEFSPQLSVQAEYRHRETEHGDIQMRGYETNFDSRYRRNLQQNTYRFGGKFSPAQHSDILFSFMHANREESLYQSILPKLPYYSQNFNVTEGYQFESQYLFHSKLFNILVGGGIYSTDVSRKSVRSNFPPNSCNSSTCKSESTAPRDLSFGYIYTYISPLKNVKGTIGLAYDLYDDLEIGSSLNISQLSPKLGFQWSLNKFFSLRLSAFQTVKASILNNQSLQPSQIAGFNQFYDDPTGTRSTNYGAGLDFHFNDKFFGGAETYQRDAKVLIGSNISKREEELYRLYFNWLPHSQWALSSELRYEIFNGASTDFLKSLDTGYIPLNLRFFNDTGFFIDVATQFVHQTSTKGDNPWEKNFHSNFFLLDAAIGYRFPQHYGMISLETKNLLDKDFIYRDRSFQINEVRATDLIPERLLFARITLNF